MFLEVEETGILTCLVINFFELNNLKIQHDACL